MHRIERCELWGRRQQVDLAVLGLERQEWGNSHMGFAGTRSVTAQDAAEEERLGAVATAGVTPLGQMLGRGASSRHKSLGIYLPTGFQLEVKTLPGSLCPSPSAGECRLPRWLGDMDGEGPLSWC